jgi:hypothetical protein
MLKNKGNKKSHFKLMKYVDTDRLLQYQVEQFKMKEFRAKSHLSEINTKNAQFALQEGQRELARIPRRPVEIKNAIIGSSQTVQPPDITIEGASSFELDYWKNIS